MPIHNIQLLRDVSMVLLLNYPLRASCKLSSISAVKIILGVYFEENVTKPLKIDIQLE